MLPLLTPRHSNTIWATPMFSRPWSLFTLEGIPYIWQAFWNSASTVSDLLLFAQYTYGINLEKPSIAVCTTNLQRIILWFPSVCQSAFGHRTLYFRQQMVPLHRSAVPTGSSSCIISLTFHCCTLIPLLCNAPSIRKVQFSKKLYLPF